MMDYAEKLDAATRALYLRYQALVEEYAKRIVGKPDSPETHALNAELAAKLDALIAEFADRSKHSDD
jgi:hypothetical protein